MQELLVKPVIASDGYTYEKHALQEWLQQHTTSPVTGLPLTHTALLPNLAIMDILNSSEAHLPKLLKSSNTCRSDRCVHDARKLKFGSIHRQQLLNSCNTVA